MQVAVLGISFQTADLHLREVVAKAAKDFFDADLFFPMILLSTCNRTEIYFSGHDLKGLCEGIVFDLQSRISLSLDNKIYSYFATDCFLHLCRVASGMESAIIGETEIQRQVKMAYQKGASLYELPGCMHYLFQKALKVSKVLRNTVDWESKRPNLHQIIWEKASSKNLTTASILFVGYSQINRQIFSYFQRKGCKNTLITSRFSLPAKQFANKYGISFLNWNDTRTFLGKDIVIVATNDQDYILSFTDFNSGEKLPKLIFDLSVPRNVDPRISSLYGLELFNIDQLDKLIEQKKGLQKHEISRCEKVLKSHVYKLVDIYRQKQKYLQTVSKLSLVSF